MSIIYDALKKAQVNLYKNRKKESPAKDRKNKSSINLKAVFVIILVLPLGIFLIWFFLNDMPINKTMFANRPLMVGTVSKNTRVDAAAALILKGILSDVNESFAIINDAILKKGESILGAVVTGIYPDRVDIMRGESKFSLYLK